MAGQSKLESNTHFYDRIISLKYFREDGTVQLRGSVDAGVKLRIIFVRGGYKVTAHFHNLIILDSFIHNPPCTVTPDGTIISIYLGDTSNGRDLYQRLFELEFYDESSSALFFRTYCSFLPSAVVATDFQELQESSARAVDRVSNRRCSEREEEEDAVDDPDDIDFQDEERNENNSTSTTASIPNDLLAFENFGESQDLWNPVRPFGNNRY